MSRDWYRDHNYSPEAASDEEYRDWAYQAGAHIDVAGNVVWPDEREHPDNLRRQAEVDDRAYEDHVTGEFL